MHGTIDVKHVSIVIAMVLCFLSPISQAAPPQANPDLRSIPTNSRITINVLINDTDPDGDTLRVVAIAQPSEGAAVLNADGSVTYTAPTTSANTTVTFTYTVEDINGEQAQGDIVITLVSQNLEPLADNTNDENIAGTLDTLCIALSNQSDAALGAAQADLLARCDQLSALATNDPATLRQALTQIAPEETSAQMRVALDTNRSQQHVIAQRVQQQKLTRQSESASSPWQVVFNGLQWGGADTTYPAGDDDSDDYPAFWSRLGLFAHVQFEEAERDRSTLENGYHANGIAFTVGADYFFSEEILLGATLSGHQNRLDYQNNAGSLDSDLTTLSLFGAYFYHDFSVYAQLGHAWLDFASTRQIRFGNTDISVNERLTGETTGAQQILNTRAEWTWRHQALTVTPFARLDYVQSRIKAYGERGGGGFAMRLGPQHSDQLSVAMGVQASYALTPSWGVWVPTLGLSYLSEANADRDPITARFAFDPDQTRTFSLNNDGGDSAFYQLSLGASAVFKHGISAFADVTRILGYDYLSAAQYQLGVRYEL